MPRKTSRKGALKRPHIVNVVGRWAQPYPYVTTISIVFIRKMQTKDLKLLKVGCEDCYSHDLAPM